ncbi:MAG: lysophospholipid acyltransferase family protein [Methylacidiphilales bacterium]|nr:lysophospholipid acyltransferase family protein [Candidatus Methylacidiphilales bacterium]
MGTDPQPPKSGHHSASLYRATWFCLGSWIARWLPLAFTRFFAVGLCRFYALAHPAKVACVHKNLTLLDQSIEKEMASRVFGEFGKTLADYFFISTRSTEKALTIIREKSGYEHLENLRAQGTGGIIVTAHLGLFELGGLFMAHHGFPTAVLTLPEPSPELTAWRSQARKKWNVDTIEVGTDPFAFIQIARQLREGCFVAALIDRPNAPDPSPVVFPNGTAYFSTGILLIALECGVPVIPATMVRQKDGFYRAEIRPPIWMESRGSRPETLRFYSQQIADSLMPTLCAHPEQWYQFVPLT